MAEWPEFLAQSTEELAAARAETKANFQGILADTEERKFYKIILLDLQKQMQVSQNVVRTLHSDPTFKPDKDSVVEQLMGQIQNMEDTVSSILVALEYGPDMGTSYRLNQAVSTLKISGGIEKVKGKSQDTYDTTVKLRANLEGVDDPGFAKIISSLTMQDFKSLRQCSRQLKERVELHCKNILILTARNKEDILAMKDLYLMPKKLNLKRNWNLTNTGLLQLLPKCSATLKDLNLWNTSISGEGLESLPLLKLEKLNLRSCDNLTNTGLQQLLCKCSATLEKLNLYGTKISGEGLESLPVLKQLEKVILGDCKNLTNTGLLQLLCKCSATLEELYLYGTEISGEGLESLPVLKQLEKVYLWSCRNLTNTGLLQLLAKCSATLEDLNLAGTKISGGILADWIARHAPGKFRRLNLRNCRNVSAADRERIRTALPQCEVF